MSRLSDGKAKYIGECVYRSREKRLAYQEEHAEEWKEQGAAFRKVRLGLSISMKEVSRYLGCSDHVIARFEQGLPVKRRRLIEHGFRVVMEYIQLRRKEIAGLL